MFELRPATKADHPALHSFLRAHASSAMFQLDHFLKRTARFWVNDAMTDVVCIGPDRMMMPIFTSAKVPGLVLSLNQEVIGGIVGPAHAVATVRAAIDLPHPMLDRVEGHYELAIDNLIMPDVTGLTLVPYALAPRDALIAMRTAYYIEALDVAPKDAPARAMTHVQKGLESQSYRVLMKGETPLALTGFNTDVGDTVMVGGIYTPPEYRGRGYAGKALALNLMAAQKRGVEKAVLSAANDAAARAYERIGFRKVGTFAIVILDEGVTIRG